MKSLLGMCPPSKTNALLRGLYPLRRAMRAMPTKQYFVDIKNPVRIKSLLGMCPPSRTNAHLRGLYPLRRAMRAMPTKQYFVDIKKPSKDKILTGMCPLSKTNADGIRHSPLRRTKAETEGFEPSIQLPVYKLSRLAPSTTRTSLHFYYFNLYSCEISRKVRTSSRTSIELGTAKLGKKTFREPIS